LGRALILLTAVGCATSGGGAGEEGLAWTRFTHRVQPGWHLRSLSLTPAGSPGQKGCPPGETPVSIELQYARADDSAATAVTSILCAPRYSNLTLAVHQTPDQKFVVGRSLPREFATPAPAPAGPRQTPLPSEPGLVPARVVREVPAQIPPVLQVSERGHQYHVSVCTAVDGHVTSLRLIAERQNPEVVGRILDALMQWKYQPAQLNGNPVPSCSWAHVAF
jgi:hypothetical protein